MAPEDFRQAARIAEQLERLSATRARFMRCEARSSISVKTANLDPLTRAVQIDLTKKEAIIEHTRVNSPKLCSYVASQQ